MGHQGYKMMFPLIKVRDKGSGHVHIVGTDSHDDLRIDHDTGHVYYYNLQNGGVSSPDEDCWYEFVGHETESYPPFGRIEFVSLEELIDIAKQEAGLSAERERNWREMTKDIFADLDKEVEQSRKEGFFHT